MQSKEKVNAEPVDAEAGPPPGMGVVTPEVIRTLDGQTPLLASHLRGRTSPVERSWCQVVLGGRKIMV